MTTDERVFYAVVTMENKPYRGEEQPTLKGGGGGGTFDGMELRIAKLESDMEHVKKDVALVQSDIRLMTDHIGGKGGLRERITAVEGKIDALPTKDWIGTRINWSVGLVVAAIGIATAFLKMTGAGP